MAAGWHTPVDCCNGLVLLLVCVLYRSGASSLPADVPAPPFPFQLEDIRPSGQPSTPEPATSDTGYYGAAAGQAPVNPYASAYAATGSQQTQQQGYGAYGSSTAAQGRSYASPSPSSSYTGYGAAAAGGSYGQQQQAPQQTFSPAAAGVAATGTTGYGASSTYGSSTGYSQQAAYGGSYGQPPQSAGQVYQQAKRAVSSTQVCIP